MKGQKPRPSSHNCSTYRVIYARIETFYYEFLSSTKWYSNKVKREKNRSFIDWWLLSEIWWKQHIFKSKYIRARALNKLSPLCSYSPWHRQLPCVCLVLGTQLVSVMSVGLSIPLRTMLWICLSILLNCILRVLEKLQQKVIWRSDLDSTLAVK